MHSKQARMQEGISQEEPRFKIKRRGRSAWKYVKKRRILEGTLYLKEKTNPRLLYDLSRARQGRGRAKKGDKTFEKEKEKCVKAWMKNEKKSMRERGMKRKKNE